MQISRYLLAASAVIVLFALALQFFFIGLALTQLGGDGDTSLHVGFGYLLPAFPLLSLILVWPARAGGRMAILVAALFVDSFVQGILPQFRSSSPVLAALHPVNAMIIVGLAIAVARGTMALARSSPVTTAPPS